MTPTRAAALLAAVLLAGCSKPRPKPTAKDDKPAEPTPTQPAPTGDPTRDAESFAKTFLKAVHDGTATPAMLTPEFKKAIAEPVFADDQAKGYSDDAAGHWLARFKGQTAPLMITPVGTGDARAIATVAGTAPPSHVLLRVVRAGDTWLADWYFTGRPDPFTVALSGEDAMYTSFAAAAFLAALVGKDDRLAEALLTPGCKARLAPPFASDKRGYNRGTLAAKLAGFRGDFTGYRVPTTAAGDTTTGELLKGDQKKPFTLKLVKGDRAWDWLVDDFKAE